MECSHDILALATNDGYPHILPQYNALQTAVRDMHTIVVNTMAMHNIVHPIRY